MGYSGPSRFPAQASGALSRNGRPRDLLLRFGHPRGRIVCVCTVQQQKACQLLIGRRASLRVPYEAQAAGSQNRQPPELTAQNIELKTREPQKQTSRQPSSSRPRHAPSSAVTIFVITREIWSLPVALRLRPGLQRPPLATQHRLERRRHTRRQTTHSGQ